MEENFVKRAVKKYFAKKGFEIQKVKKRGVDLKFLQSNRKCYLYVECKGISMKERENETKGEKKNRIRSNIVNTISNSLMQIIKRMGKKDNPTKTQKKCNKYAIAYPIIFKPIIMKLVPCHFYKKLKISLLFVDYEGEVGEFNYKKLKDEKICLD